jgi:hypothetical protein
VYIEKSIAQVESSTFGLGILDKIAGDALRAFPMEESNFYAK